MASFKKVAGKWQAEVRTKGFYKSKRFHSKHEAQAWALDLEMSRGKRGMQTTGGKTVRDAFLKYADDVAPTHKGARWEIIRLNKLSKAGFASIMLDDVTAQDIQDWADAELRRLKPASVHRELQLIGAVLRVARIRWKWMDADVMKDVIRPKKPPARDRLLTADEIKLILTGLEYEEGAPVRHSRHEIAVCFLLAIETAMRQGELFGLDWKDVHLKEQYVHLPDTKNGSKRDVPLSKRAVALLKSLPRPHQHKVFSVPQATAGQIYRRTLTLVGIEGLTFHDTRHYAITQLAQKLEMLDLARMVGHRDPRSLMIYYNATASDIAKRLG